MLRFHERNSTVRGSLLGIYAENSDSCNYSLLIYFQIDKDPDVKFDKLFVVGDTMPVEVCEKAGSLYSSF